MVRKMSIVKDSRENGKDTLVLALEGRIDVRTSQEFEEELVRYAGRARYFVMDMSDVTYVSSAGLRVFITLFKTLAKVNGSLKLAALQPAVERVFRLTTVFDLRPSVASALESLPHP